MKYWYLKEGDILGPWTAEEIAKDNLFTGDALVCPQDKAEDAEFWKPANTYNEDFAAILSGDIEMEIPQEVALDDIEIDYSSNETAKEEIAKEKTAKEETPKAEIKEEKKEEISQTSAEEVFREEEVPSILEPKPQEPKNKEEKNPFETDRPQIAPNLEDTISSHTIAPRLDDDGDTLLEDIPAKAILSDKEEDFEQVNNLVSDKSLPTEDTLEDTPILNVFEKPQQKTKELKDISENIYDKYGADKGQREDLKIKTVDENSDLEKHTKNNKIYLLLIVMFVLVVIALVLAFTGSGNEIIQSAKPVSMPKNNIIAKEEPAKQVSSIAEIPPTTDTSAYVNNVQANADDTQRAIAKVKRFILPNGKTLEEYLNNKYASYQTSWVADVLSGNNYYVHFNASKIRQEPMIYSFSIDLDKNEINGLNNLGIDLLMKGE